MIEEVVFGFIAIVVSVVLVWYALLWKYTLYLRKIPGPIRLPLVGNAHEISSTTLFLPKLLKWQKKYGGYFQITIGFQPPSIFISDPKFLQLILSSTEILDKSVTYKLLHNWLKDGLLLGTGAKWKKHRKLIVPAFHFKILEQFVEVFERNGDTFLEKLEQELTSESFDVYPYVTLLALDVICETALGTSVNAQNDSQSAYVKSVKFMCNTFMERLFSPLKYFDLFYQFTDLCQKEKEALKILHGASKAVIKKRKSEPVAGGAVTNEEDFGIKGKLAFLDLLLQSNENGEFLTDEEIQEEVDTFMFEGHDTVSSAISFTLYNLSMHPDVQEKVVAELQSIFGDCIDRACIYNDFQEMKYLEAVIKETLRLYPSVPVYGRTLSEDLTYDGHLIPKGTMLLIFAYGTARNEEFFPDPERFDPDRFINYSLSNRYPYLYLPFSAGPRNCIGQKYAMMEIKCIISKFLRRYELLPAHPKRNLHLSSEVTLKSLNGVHIRIRKRPSK